MSPLRNLELRRWLSRDAWRLHNTESWRAAEDGWSNEDVDVVPPEKRTWAAIDYLWLWLSDGANVGTMQQAGSIVALGLSWREASVAMYVSNQGGLVSRESSADHQ